MATAAGSIPRAAGTSTTIPGARLTAITASGDIHRGSLVIEATEPVPYVAMRPDPLTVVVDFRNVDAAAAGPAINADRNGPIASVAVEAAESMGSPVSRVRIALAQPLAYHVRAERNRVVIDFDGAAAATPAASIASARGAAPVVQPGVDPIAALGLVERPAARAPKPGVAQLLAAGAQVAPGVGSLRATTTSAVQAPGGGSDSQAIGAPRSGRAYSGNPVSLDFQQADLRSVLRVFSDISGLNIVIDPAVRGVVDVALRDVPWDQALDIILRANKLGYVVDGTVVRIAPITTLSDEEAQRRKLADEQALAGELQTVTRTLSYAHAEELQLLLPKSVLSARGTVQFDPRTNTLIIRDLADRLPAVTDLIATLDKAQPQVEIEARIVQASKSFSRTIGVNWGINGAVSSALGNTTGLAFPNNGSITGAAVTGTATGTGTPTTTNSVVGLAAPAATSGIGLALGSVNGAFNLDVALTAAESAGNLKVLSTPRVTAQNNGEAEITQGVQIPIQTVANNTVTVTFKDAALTLKVTPQISAAGTVIMKIALENAQPDYSRQVNGIPPINTQRANTQVLVGDGQTTVIGGIFTSQQQNSNDRTPGLSQVPLLRWLFKRDAITDDSSELLIFLTPRISKS
jgi:type IV pilus assembly protein PilQ